jgi:diguanylate cyclase (GGDEF)-like protein
MEAHSGTTTPTPTLEPVVQARLVEDGRRRAGSRLYGREQVTTLATALGFVATALSLRAVLPAEPMPSVATGILLVFGYAVMSRVEFELGSGVFMPTQLVLVPMLFLVPPAALPLLVSVGFVAGGLPDFVRGRMPAERVFVRLSYSWYAVGPALVLGLAHPGPPAWDRWPLYALALAAQFAFDLASALGREWLGVGVPPRTLLPVLGRAYLVDLLLAPVGFLAALAASQHPLGFLPVLSLALLLALLARDRRTQIGETIELSDAYETASTVARRDGLTGFANRRAWDEHLADVAARPDKHPVSVIMVDLDGLKLANDTRGHAFGDELIQAAASVIAQCVRDRDVTARLGGDEIGVLLFTDEAGCADVVHRLEEALEQHPGVDGFPLSFSMGAATTPPEASVEAAVAVADERMYERKRHSRLARKPGSG